MSKLIRFVGRHSFNVLSTVATFLVVRLPGFVDDVRAEDEYVDVKPEWIIR